jgi:hypothetical protein
VIKQIFKWLKIILAVLLLYLVARCQYLKRLPPRTFPTDKEMLQYFNQHRSEIERLVKLHREFYYLENLKPSSTPLDKAEQDMLMKKAGVKRIIGSSIGSRWYPDNYSEHTKHTLKSIDNLRSTFYDNPNHGLIEPEIINILKKEIPSLFTKDIPLLNVIQLADLTQVMEIELTDYRYEMMEVRKVYMHFPQPPLTQNNRIMVHDTFYEALVAAERVLDTLDNPPKDWKPGECLLKTIDIQWFMATCRSYDYPI